MQNYISNAPVSVFKVHPLVANTYREKDLTTLSFSLNKVGQQNPISVVEKNGELLIVDGISRFNALKHIAIESLIYEIVDVPEDRIIAYRMIKNQRTNRTLTEQCLQTEYILGMVGMSQGKKRDLLGFEDMLNDSNFGEIGKDRYELACALMGLEIRSSSLRKLMKVFWSEYVPGSQSKSGILELLDSGKISIDKAHKLVFLVEKKKDEINAAELRMIEGRTHDVSYQLYCKSSIEMIEVPDKTVQLAAQSAPYYNLREYRNQGESPHGQESTVQEYVQKQVEFAREIRRTLKEDGVCVLIFGETYQNGYQGVCTKLETAFENDGWTIIDVVIWEKNNPKPTPHSNRFLASYERIFVMSPNGGKVKFNPVTKKSTSPIMKVVSGSKRKNGTNGVYIKSPQSAITNVITTSVFNKSEWGNIDPNFTHDAPAPKKIFEPFILAYTDPGDIVLDGFCGSGQSLVCAMEHGRNVIGYDIDPVSIDFTRKRLENCLAERGQEQAISIAA